MRNNKKTSKFFRKFFFVIEHWSVACLHPLLVEEGIPKNDIDPTAVRDNYMPDVTEEQAHSSVAHRKRSYCSYYSSHDFRVSPYCYFSLDFYSHVLCDKNLQDSEKLSGYMECRKQLLWRTTGQIRGP